MGRASLIGNTAWIFGKVSTYIADGAISLNDYVALLDASVATCNMTLADGVEGQKITIKAIDVTAGSPVLTPAHLAGGATIELSAANDAVELVFDGTDWQVASVYGTAAGVPGNVTVYSANGAIALTDRTALLDASTATANMTLADGVKGQEIIIKAIDITSGAPVVTPDNLADGTTITLTAANDAARLVFDGTDWQVAGIYGTTAVV